MRKIQARVLVSLAVVLAAAVAGVYTSAGLAPERLRTEIERVLQRATGSPVSMGSLRLVVGFPIHLDATNLRLWGGALTIDRATARVDAFSLLTGRPRLSRLVLDGAHLRIQRAQGDGEPHWRPEPFARLAGRAGRQRAEPVLAPLHGIEATVRFLLSRPWLADTVQLQQSRVSYAHDFSDRGGEIETLWFAGVHGVLRHSRLRGHASLFLATRVLARDGPRGSIEWEGTRSREGAIRISMAATELELGTIVPYVNQGRHESQLRGRLSGIADFETTTPGEGRLSLDLVVRDFESSVDADEGGSPRWVAVDAFSSRMEVAVDAGFLELSNARVWGPELGFGLEAVVERPIRPESNAGLAVSLEDIDLAQARALVGWLPGSIRERAQGIAYSIRSGRIAAVEVRGGATLQQWRDAVSRRADQLPRGFQVLADVENIEIALDELDRLEDVSGRITWSEDRLVVEGATGMLNGAPLPELDVSFSGIGRLLGSEHRRRVEATGAVPLAGLTPLWTALSQGDEAMDEPVPPIWIEIEHLHHPALFWPFEEVHTRFEPTEDGAHLIVSRGRWAGVPLHGAVDFSFRPERRVGVWLQAGIEGAENEPDDDTGQDDPRRPGDAHSDNDIGGAWASGRFEVGATLGGAWRQYTARGRFRAALGEMHFEELVAELAPAGTLRASGKLDLSRNDEVPFDLRFSLDGGDVSTLIAQGGFEGDVATGQLDLHGALSGSIGPGRAPFTGISGLLRLEAVDGTIQRSVPPILAVALASEAFAGFSSREHLRYRRCATTLSFEEGYVSTESFDLDGPDVRLFASGGLDLAHAPHEIDAEVVLFLFRQIDRALEKIPLLNVLLLGDNDNLIAAYYELVGPWEEPEAVGKPLRTLGEGPGTVLIEGIPKVVKRGLEALGELVDSPKQPAPRGKQPALPLARLGES